MDSDLLTPQPPPGLQYVAGGAITQAMINAASAAGMSGLYLDPRYIYTAVGPLVIPTRFDIQSDMWYGLGFSSFGSPATPPAYILFSNATGDCFQISGNGTQSSGNSISLVSINIIGNTTGAVVHLGGGQRNVTINQCFVWNKNSTVNAFAFVTDTALANFNGEDNLFMNSAFFGAYAGIGIGIADQTQHSNDCLWIDIQCGGGTYGIIGTAGGTHQFHNFYDRSNESTATIWANGAIMIFFGGELQNTTGNEIQLTSGTVSLNSVALTQAGGQTTVVNYTGAGNLFVHGKSAFNNSATIAMGANAGTLVLDVSVNTTTLTITGTSTSAQLWYYANSPYTKPTISGFSGQVIVGGFPNRPFHQAGTGITTTTTINYAPPPLNGLVYRVTIRLRVTTAGTSTIPTIQFTNQGGTSADFFNQTIQIGSVSVSYLDLILIAAAVVATAVIVVVARRK